MTREIRGWRNPEAEGRRALVRILLSVLVLLALAFPLVSWLVGRGLRDIAFILMKDSSQVCPKPRGQWIPTCAIRYTSERDTPP